MKKKKSECSMHGSKFSATYQWIFDSGYVAAARYLDLINLEPF